MPLEERQQRHAYGPPDEASDGPAHDQDDEMQKEGVVVVHIFSKRDIEPDYSGYVDEYRFIPLTPSLEETLAEMVSKRTFSRKDEALELEELGYIRDLMFHTSTACTFRIAAKGRCYAAEAEAYRERRDRWAAARAEDERRRGRSVFMREAAIALLSVVAGFAAAHITG